MADVPFHMTRIRVRFYEQTMPESVKRHEAVEPLLAVIRQVARIEHPSTRQATMRARVLASSLYMPLSYLTAQAQAREGEAKVHVYCS